MTRALAAGTVLALLVTGVWSVTAAATIGDAPPMHLTWHHPLASYLALAAGPAGNGWALFGVLSVIYTLCLLIEGWRRSREDR